MSGLEVAGVVLSVVPVAITVLETVGGIARSLFFFLEYYGPPGLILYVFGSRGMWQLQAQVLCSPDDRQVMDFKTSAQADSNIIAVAATIIAQIAITALSLADLSRTHWVARGAFTFSLLSAIMAVYYATSQYRKMGRCLRPVQVRAWIKGKRHRYSWQPANSKRVLYQDVLPSTASVLTVSAPNMLLSASLNSFLVGLGVYFGQIWIRSLDEDAGDYASRAVFITYIVSLLVCYSIFGLSSLVVAGESYQSEREFLDLVQPNLTAEDGHLRHAETVQNGPVGGEAMRVSSSRIVEQDVEATGSRSPPSVDDSVTPPQQDNGSAPLKEGDKQELVSALRDLVALRKKAAEVDERIVQILTKLQ
ncbi:hypothetical protein NX059_005863 [Plenodomus lindquistii]|nr:hypothetical protein NX059_005863 [Plenodomus lindquistii]